jgi:type IV secretory pathway VirD2 relaxase
MRSVVKHSFIKGADRGARAKAHINYIQYRAGEDRENGPRAFFNGDRENILGREVKEQIDKVDARFVHKVILSPGVEGVDIQAYTKSIMTQLGKEKGLELDWAAVAHTNTAHDHAHVVIQGRDKFNKEVQLRLKDCTLMREYGDRYLEKHHTY